MPSRFAFLEHAGPLAFAHRGGMAGGLENSMTAFERAVRLGYHYLETDVRVTADGVLLAFHDDTLDRVTDRRGKVRELTYADVAEARIGGREPIPRVAELLDAWPHVRLNLDVKEPEAIAPLARLLRQPGAAERVCVASFSESRLAAVRALLGPAVCTSLGPRGAFALRLASYSSLLAPLARGAIPCAQLPSRVRGVPVVTRSLLHTAHRLGMQVHAWTINDPAEMTRLLDMGVDGIMTDRVDELRDVLAARGAWNGI